MSTLAPVQTCLQAIADKNDPFTFRSGESLSEAHLAYETLGELNEQKSNAILLFHAFSGSHHAAGFCPENPYSPYWTEECHFGWWERFIGPGKAIDTDQFFVICANYIGGCYGSTGPSTTNPDTGSPYGRLFPHICVNDIVRSQIRLLDAMGIEKLHAVVGPSTGGLACINFATMYPERTSRVIPIATGMRTTVLNRIMLLEQILAIENDPHFAAGDYYGRESLPHSGLTLARMMSHKTFVHLDAIERRARKDVVKDEDRFSWYQPNNHVESYMLHQGKKFTDRFDANTYLRICEMWSTFDPVKQGQADDVTSLFARSREAGHRYLVFSIDEDYCFYPEEQTALVNGLKSAEVDHMFITVHSEKGHDSFLLEPELYMPHMQFVLS
ncbi:MAG: homoserine O-acetyltransferase [Verrucomicrobiales bacterium]|nr:homoserine O-acetyltransferase [Verrucomicrobiales bacterium]